MNLHNNHAGTADDDDENDKHEAHEPVNVVELVVPKRSENEVPRHDEQSVAEGGKHCSRVELTSQ